METNRFFVVINDFFNVFERLMVIYIVVERNHASIIDYGPRKLSLIVGSAYEASHKCSPPIVRGMLDCSAAAEFRQAACNGAQIEASA